MFKDRESLYNTEDAVKSQVKSMFKHNSEGDSSDNDNDVPMDNAAASAQQILNN